MLASCRVIHLMAPAQDGHILAAVPLPQRDILDAAVSMNRVIPIGKGMRPVTRRCQTRERLQIIQMLQKCLTYSNARMPKMFDCKTDFHRIRQSDKTPAKLLAFIGLAQDKF